MNSDTQRQAANSSHSWPSGTTRWFALIAVAWGAVVLLITMFLPTVSDVNTNAQHTLVQAYGYWVLGPACIPLAAAIVVGWLLRFGLRTASRRVALTSAWALSGTLLAAAIVGFLTFFLGLFVIPGAAALVAAVACVLPPPAGKSPRVFASR